MSHFLSIGLLVNALDMTYVMNFDVLVLRPYTIFSEQTPPLFTQIPKENYKSLLLEYNKISNQNFIIFNGS